MKTKQAGILFAQAILDCAKAREDSFDKKACAAAKRKAARESKKNPDAVLDPSFLIDFDKFYTMSLREACEKTAPEFAEPVYLLLSYVWNDALDWANERIALG